MENEQTLTGAGAAKAPMTMQTPTIGRIVAYRHPKQPGVPEFLCPGIVESLSVDGPAGACNLTLFIRGHASYVENATQGTDAGQWMFPARAGA